MSVKKMFEQDHSASRLTNTQIPTSRKGQCSKQMKKLIEENNKLKRQH